MNKCMLIGRLTRDCETKEVGQTSLTKFSIAVARQFKKDETDFINCQAWGKTGEIIQQYIKKGDAIAITGNIRTGSYDKDGKKVYTTDIVVESFDFINGNKADNNNSNKESFEKYMEPVDSEDCPF